MKLLFVVVNTEELSDSYAFDVELRGSIGEILDRDRFRWAKQTKRVLLNQAELEANNIPPQDWELLGQFEVREANHFSYRELADVAARQFQRRQGLIQKVLGLAWQPASFMVTQGEAIADMAPALRNRLIAMKGAMLEVDAPSVSGILQALPPSGGDVVTISTDWDAYANQTDINSASGALYVGDTPEIYRSAARFPLGSLPSGATISDTDLKVNVAIIGGAIDIQAYNQNGQANPSLDDITAFRARCADDATPYQDEYTYPSTGIVTTQLPAGANSDVEAAKSAVNRFSIGWNEGVAAETRTQLEALEAAGTEEPRLVITYTAAAGQAPRTMHIVRMRRR